MTNKKPVILWFKDTLKRLWISKTYLYTLVKENKILYQKISNWTVFLEEDIIAFEKQRENKAKIDPRIKIKNK